MTEVGPIRTRLHPRPPLQSPGCLPQRLTLEVPLLVFCKFPVLLTL